MEIMGRRSQNDCGSTVRYTVTVLCAREGVEPVHVILDQLKLEDVSRELDRLELDFDVLTVCISKQH